jgi:hypothetical protein
MYCDIMGTVEPLKPRLEWGGVEPRTYSSGGKRVLDRLLPGEQEPGGQEAGGGTEQG